VSQLTSIAAEIISLPTPSMLRATVSERASLAGFTILATAPIGGDVVGAIFASTESILAARIALIVSTAVALSGTAVSECTSFSDFAVDASTTAVTGDLAGCALASTELGLTTSIAVLRFDADHPPSEQQPPYVLPVQVFPLKLPQRPSVEMEPELALQVPKAV
jgi:hypothetical protein